MDICVLIFLTIIFSILAMIVCRQIREDFQQQSKDPEIEKIKSKLRLLYPKIDELEFYEGEKSYTIDKQKVHLCLRDENGEYYHQNMLMYVSIHELAHVLCNEIGHTEKFYQIFHRLLDRAIDLKIYDPAIPVVPNYCKYRE
jgi:hypothetical protein